MGRVGMYWIILVCWTIKMAAAFPAAPIIVGPAASQLTAPDFCSRAVVSRTSCPTPPTPPDLDLNTLLGSYYEIGSTARYKLRNELGTACTHTNFTLASTRAFSGSSSAADTSLAAGTLVDITSSGIHVVSALPILTVLSRMASSARRVCSTASRMCDVMAPSSRLSDASSRLSAAFDELAPSNPAAASALAEASAALNASVVGVHARLDRLSRSISFASAAVATALDQGLGSEVALRGVRGASTVASVEARDLASAVVYNLTAVGTFVEGVLERLPSSDMSNVRQLLQEAASFIDAEIDDAIAQVLGVQEQLLTLGGPLVEMAAADFRSGRWARILSGRAAPGGGGNNRVMLRSARATIAKINNPSTATEDTSSSTSTNTTDAVDSATAAGEGAVPPSPTSSSSSAEETEAEELHIIAAEGGGGIGVGEYEAVLVYSCSSREEGEAPSTDLVLLSRTPYLPPATVLRILATAASYGIFTDCDNPFVPTVQRPDLCAARP